VGKVILLFVVVPLVETYLLAHIGAAIGWANTIALVIVTGVFGGWLAKLEGARAWHRWRAALAEGRVPEEGVLEGLLLLIGGALLITPGVLTDALGLALLIPTTRRLVAGFIRPRIEQRVQQQASTVVEQSRVRVIRFGAGGPAGGLGLYPFEHGAADMGGEPGVIGRQPPRSATPRGSTPPGSTPPGSTLHQPQEVIDAEFDVHNSDED
jgi:UPF0716 protein FxsA